MRRSGTSGPKHPHGIRGCRSEPAGSAVGARALRPCSLDHVQKMMQRSEKLYVMAENRVFKAEIDAVVKRIDRERGTRNQPADAGLDGYVAGNDHVWSSGTTER